MKDEINRLIKFMADALEENQDFPKRIDEMTESEYAIAKMACGLYGTLGYAKKRLEDIMQEWTPEKVQTLKDCVGHRGYVVKLNDWIVTDIVTSLDALTADEPYGWVGVDHGEPIHGLSENPPGRFKVYALVEDWQDGVLA